jgi:hypothetical protein
MGWSLLIKVSKILDLHQNWRTRPFLIMFLVCHQFWGDATGGERQQIYFTKAVHDFRPLNVSGLFVGSDYFPPAIALIS